MSGTGKYTNYAPAATPQNNLLNKLFRSNDATQKPIVQDLVGKEEDVRKIIVEMGKALLTPSHQTGDMRQFPGGVDFNFTSSPKVEEVKWSRPGDPATAYFPDISSPGPGNVDGVDKKVDPQLTNADIKPNYVQGAPDTGTKSPAKTADKIVKSITLGVDGKLGDSGANS